MSGRSTWRLSVEPWAERWEKHYALSVVAIDVLSLSVFVALTSGYAYSFGSRDVVVTLIVVTGIGMCCALIAVGAWRPRVLGQGSDEFNRLIRALVIRGAVVLTLVGLAVSAPATRPWVFGVIPAAGVMAVLARYSLRQIRRRQRRGGRCLHRVLAVGSDETIGDLVECIGREANWIICGACTPSGAGAEDSATIGDVPVVGDLDSVARRAIDEGFRVVAVASSAGWSPHRLRQVAWDVEGTGIGLVVQPGLMEIAGPHHHVSPVDGLPLLRLTEPAFTGVPLLLKAVADRFVAALLVLLMAPVLLGIAVAVWLDGGPTSFRQIRLGRDGRHFRVIKLRSMVVDAGQRCASLLADDDVAGPPFNLREDPRIAPVGRWLRRFSLDEVPQLFNVIGGSMSLVGPRPPLPDEVETYSPDAMRRLLVKPGLTGLCQISGQSDPSREESVPLELRYVENWNLAMDAMICGRRSVQSSVPIAPTDRGARPAAGPPEPARAG